MPRTLRDISGSAGVTLPKDDLVRDDVLEEDGSVPDDTTAFVDRLGRRTYLVRIPESGSVRDLQETEVVEQAAARLLLQQDGVGFRARGD